MGVLYPTEIGQSSGVPMVLIIDAVKAMLGEQIMNWLVLIVCAYWRYLYLIAGPKKGPLAKFHEKDGWGTGILFICPRSSPSPLPQCPPLSTPSAPAPPRAR